MESVDRDITPRPPNALPRGDAQGVAGFLCALVPALVVHLYAFRAEIVAAGTTFVASVILCAAAAAAVSQLIGESTRRVPQASVVVTGLLLPFCLPALPAYWLLALGAVLATAFGRFRVPWGAAGMLQPLLLTGMLLRFAFPHQMGVAPGIDAISGATVLGLRTMQEFLTSAAGTPSPELYLGIASMSLAGTMGLPLLLGGIYLVVRGVVGWQIPLAFFAAVALLSTEAWRVDARHFLSPVYHVFGGDLVLGAFFLATDPRGSPRRPGAQALFGFGCGAITVLARMADWFPSSVPLAVLAMNLCSPLLDRLPFRESVRSADVSPPSRRRRLAIVGTVLAVIVIGGGAAWRALQRLGSARDITKAQTIAEMVQQQPGDAPLKWVYSVPAGLYFTQTEITVAQFAQCVKAGACERGYEVASQQPNCNVGYPDRRDHPMNCLNWKGAERYCAWVGGRLPTETEWYAEASNGGTLRYPWGNEEPTCDRAVIGDTELGDGCGAGRTWPVCSKPLGNSVSGLCDMVGNVWEWTATEQRNEYFFIRGGGWNVARLESLQSSARSYLSAYFRGFGSVGFRCVRQGTSG